MANTQKAKPADIQVRIDKLLDGDSATKAFASLTIGGTFAVHDIRITEKDDGIRVSMPFRSYTAGGKKQYADIFHPITAEARTAMFEAVKAAYEQALVHQAAEQNQNGMTPQM